MSESQTYPRVAYLTYELVVEDKHPDRYEGAKPLDWKLGDFDCRLDGNSLAATPLVHFGDSWDAERALEAHLRAWEAHAEIKHGVRIKFRPTGALMLEAEEEEGEQGDWSDVTIRVPSASAVASEGEVTVKIRENHYPFPPRTPFKETETLTLLIDRYRDLREGREKLLQVGYYVLKKIEQEYARNKPVRASAAQELSVDPAVLQKLGEVTSARAHPTQDRKPTKGPALRDDEETWVRVVIPRLLIRMGEKEGGAKLDRITMKDFPTLGRPLELDP